MREIGVIVKALLVVTVMVSLATLACRMASMGSLSVNDPPSPFDLVGENDYTWDATLTANGRYEIIVTAQNTVHPIDQIKIIVRNDNLEDIAEKPIIQEDTMRTNFTAPSNGHVSVIIFSLIGVHPEELGTHTIQLRAIQ
jgi:hypothetical protein